MYHSQFTAPNVNLFYDILVGRLTTLSASRLYGADDISLMSVEQRVEWELTKETEVLEENPGQCHFVHHKSNMA
jgi:hypothetical protein